MQAIRASHERARRQSEYGVEGAMARWELELLWRGSASFGTEADVFTGNFADGAHMQLAELAI